MRRLVVCPSVCHFVLVFFSPFSIAITSVGEERANLSAFRTFVRFVLVWICRFVIMALPGLFSYLFFSPCYFVVYCTRQLVLFLTLRYSVLVFFSPFSIAITSLGEETTNH